MAVTYGFYNSLNGDRTYNAEQMSAIFDGIITDGVFSSIGGALMTIAGEGMQVLVKTGKAWFNSTWTLNDAQMALAVDTADVSLTRIDAVVLEVNSGVSTRENSIKMVKGTPSANPTKPTMASDEDLHQYALAYITVGAGVTSITSANIEVNVGKDSCPFITSVLQQTSVSDLFNQWEAEFDAWFANIKAQLAGDVATNLQSQIDELKIGKTAQAQYGLTSVYPNDYIEWLGKYNEYWWSLLHLNGSYKIQLGSAYPSASGYSGNRVIVFSVNSSGDDTILSVADSVSVDSSGNITLDNPTNYTYYAGSDYSFNSVNNNPVESMYGKYCSVSVKTDSINAGEIFYVPSGTATSYYAWDIGVATAYPVNSIYISSNTTTYAHSTDRNAYPDSGTVDGITYTYLGCPFEKFPTAPQIETGSYTGVGLCTSANPNSLTFGITPQFVVITPQQSYWHSGTNYSGGVGPVILVRGMTKYYTPYIARNTTGTVLNGGDFYITWSGNTLSWYNTGTEALQLNASGVTYYYIALG